MPASKLKLKHVNIPARRLTFDASGFNLTTKDVPQIEVTWGEKDVSGIFGVMINVTDTQSLASALDLLTDLTTVAKAKWLAAKQIVKDSVDQVP